MKKGFTLAELLVTLGVLGVISAITLPGLINNATDAKIGPSLAKAVASFDHANKAFLSDQDVEALTDTDQLSDLSHLSNYLQTLTDYMYVENKDSTSLISEEGFKNEFKTKESTPSSTSTPHLQELTVCIIDINGEESPNVDGTDRFYFKLMNDGSLQPYGANGDWRSRCPVDRVPSDYQYCAGHIFENNFKVLYK